MLRSLIKDSAVYGMSSLITRGLSLILIPVYTRVLTPEDYGSLDLLLVFASLINLTVALEVSQGLARHYAAEPDPHRRVAYASTALWFTVICYTVFAGFSAWHADRLAPVLMGQDELAHAFRLGVAYIWLNGIFYLVQNQFRWELRSANYAIASLTMATTTGVVAVAMTSGFGLGLVGLLYGMIGGAAVGLIYGLIQLRTSFTILFDRSALAQMLAFSAPLVLSGIAVFLSTYVDRLMINHFLSIAEVGLYAVGFRLANIAGLAMIAFQGALTPLVFTYYRRPETPYQLAQIFRIFIALALLLSLGLILFARDILATMTTPTYLGAASVIGLLVPSILLAQMYIFAPGIAIAKRTHLLLAINLVTASMNIGLNWVLIPSLGIEGAALATLLSNGAAFAANMLLSQRLYSVPHDWVPLTIATTAIASIALASQSLSPEGSPGILLKLLAMIVAILIVFAAGLVRRTEITRLHALLRSRLSLLFRTSDTNS